MARMYVAFLLDLFQPSSQTRTMVDRIASECYSPLGELLNSDLKPRFSISLANSLADLLMRCGRDEIIDGFKKAMDRGHIELIHTGAYHPVFPLIPEQEVKRQIELDIEFKSRHFGLLERTGVFSPELCYDDKLLPLYRELNFRWTLIDDVVMEMNGIQIPQNEILRVDEIAVLMRSSFWSDRIRRPNDAGHYLTGRQFVGDLRQELEAQQRDCYKIIAISGETFGHHVPYFQETFLRDMLFALRDSESVILCKVSDLLQVDLLPRLEKTPEPNKPFRYFPPCSWATRPENYERGDPYPLWKSKGNPVHEQLWNLTELLFDACGSIDLDNPGHRDLRELLDRAFYSTQYYWASIWSWKPELICQGIDLQMRALYAYARLVRNQDVLYEGEGIYTRLMWEIHLRDEEEKAKRGNGQHCQP